MVDRVMKRPEGSRIMILAPVIREKKGEHTKVMETLSKEGFARARIDGEIMELDGEIKLERQKKHSIAAVVDRIIVREESAQRVADSIETALKMAEGLVIIHDVQTGQDTLQSEHFACADCGISIEEISPRMFSFNSPYGACPECTGLGMIMKVDPDTLVVDKKKSFNQGAIRMSGWNFAVPGTIAHQFMQALTREYDFSADTPYEELPQNIKDLIMYGNNGKKNRNQLQQRRPPGRIFCRV